MELTTLNSNNVEFHLAAIAIGNYTGNIENSRNILFSNIEVNYIDPLYKTVYKAYEYLKTNKDLTTPKEKVSIFLEKEGIESNTITKFLNLTTDIDPKNIVELLISKYKQREISKKTKELSLTTNLTDKEILIEELKQLSLIKEITIELPDAKSCISEYIKQQKRTKELAKDNFGMVGISTGVDELDEKIRGLKEQEYAILAARPSMGKTAMVVGMFREALKRPDKGVPVLFSIEMSKEAMLGRLLAQGSKKLGLAQTMYGITTEEEDKEIENLLNILSKRSFYIEDFAKGKYDMNNGVTPELLERILLEIEQKEGKISAIYIDYLQLMSSEKKSTGFDLNAKMGDISSKIKALSKRFNCPVVALSQLNRSLENRVDKRPKLSDLRDSGSLEQDADLIMFMYRPEVYLEAELREKAKSGGAGVMKQLEILKNAPVSDAEIIVGKQRNGSTGIVSAQFRKNNAKYENADHTLEDIIREVYKSGDNKEDIYKTD